MTSTASSIALVSVGALTGYLYITCKYYIPMKKQYMIEKQKIYSLNEEIVRLKREMRICGIYVPQDDNSTECYTTSFHYRSSDK